MVSSKLPQLATLLILCGLGALVYAQSPPEEKKEKPNTFSFSFSTTDEAEAHPKVFINQDGTWQGYSGETHGSGVVTSQSGKGGVPNVFYFSTDGDAQNRLVTFEFRPKHGFLGIESVELTEELRIHFGAPANAGIMIGKVVEEGPASSAGFRVGDILTHLDGKPVASSADLLKVLLATQPGDPLDADLWRNGKVVETQVVLGEFQKEPKGHTLVTTKADVLLQSLHAAPFQIRTAKFPESAQVEWIHAPQADLQEQILTLQRKIEALEALILKKSGSKNAP